MKSIEVKFAEAMDAIKKCRLTKKFDEKAKGCTTIESKLNAAEALLEEMGIIRESETKLTGRVEEPKPHVTKKNNGVSDNRSESNPFRHGELLVESFSPGYTQKNTALSESAKSNKVMADAWLKAGKITVEEHRKMTGAEPKEYEALNEAQRKAFDFHRAIGISEADCFKLAKINVNTELKEVSR